jgi:hypothetical protein
MHTRTNITAVLALEASWDAQQSGLPPDTVAYTSRLPVTALVLALDVFQPRLRDGGEQDAFNKHVADLCAVLGDPKVQRAGFKPLDVFPIAGQWYLLDGHARYAAYRKAGHTAPVPVRVFKGNFRAALQFSRSQNSELRLVWSKRERLQAVWDLVVLRDTAPANGRWSYRQIADATGWKKSKVGAMAQVLVKGLDGYTREELRSMSWAEVDRLNKGLTQEEFMREEAVRKLAEQLKRQFSTQLYRRRDATELFAEAFVHAFGDAKSGRLCRALSRIAAADFDEFAPVEEEDGDF